jgi:hypothetical protein
MIGIYLKLESKDQLLAGVWLSNKALPLALHARSQLFMATLTGKSC